jgi:hypothetical protein
VKGIRRRDLLLIVALPIIVGMASGTTWCARSRQRDGICGATPIPSTVVPVPRSVALTSLQDFTPVGCGDTYKLVLSFTSSGNATGPVAKAIDAHLASLGWKQPACAADFCRMSAKDNVIVAISVKGGDADRATVTASPLKGKNIESQSFGQELLRCARLSR